MILPLSDLYPTCPRCGGECVHLGPSVWDESDDDSLESFDYIACEECHGLGSRLARGGRLILEMLRLNPRSAIY